MGAKKKYRVYKKGGESFKPHMMYNPETGEGFMAQEYQEHLKMDNMGYGHEPMMRMGGMPCYECGGGVHYEYGGSTAPQNTSTDTIGQQRKDLMKNYMAGNIYMNMLDEEQQRIQDNIQNYFASGGSTYNPNLYGQQAYASAIDAQKKQFKKDVKGFGKALINTAGIIDKHRGMNQQQQAQNKPLTFSPQSMDAMPNTGFGSKQPDMFGRNTDQSFGQGNPMTLGADFNKPVGGFNPDLYMAYGGDIPMYQGGGGAFSNWLDNLIKSTAQGVATPEFPAGQIAAETMIPGYADFQQWAKNNPQDAAKLVGVYNDPARAAAMWYETNYKYPKPKESDYDLSTTAGQKAYSRAKQKWDQETPADTKELYKQWDTFGQTTSTVEDTKDTKTTTAGKSDKDYYDEFNKKVSKEIQDKAKQSTEGKTATEVNEIEDAQEKVNKAKEEAIKETQPNYKETEGDKVVTTDGQTYYTQQPQTGFYGGPGFKYKARGWERDPITGKKVRMKRQKFKSPTGGDFFGFGRSGSPRKIKNTYNIYNNPYMYQMPGAQNMPQRTGDVERVQSLPFTGSDMRGLQIPEGGYQGVTADFTDPMMTRSLMDQGYSFDQAVSLQDTANQPGRFTSDNQATPAAEDNLMQYLSKMYAKSQAKPTSEPKLYSEFDYLNRAYGGNIPMAQDGFTGPAATGDNAYIEPITPLGMTAEPLNPQLQIPAGGYQGATMDMAGDPQKTGQIKEKVKKQGTGMGRAIASEMLLPTANLIAGLAENAQMQDPLTDSSQVFSVTGMDQGMQDINKGQVVDTVYAQDPGNYGAANKAQKGMTMPSDNTRTNQRMVPQQIQEGNIQQMIDAAAAYQAQLDMLNSPYTAIAVPDYNSTFPNDSVRYFPGQMGPQGVPYIKDLGNLAGVSGRNSAQDFIDIVNSGKGRMYQDTSAVRANPKMMWNEPNYKYGGGQPQYEDGGVYDLTPDEIERVLAMGGSIEYM